MFHYYTKNTLFFLILLLSPVKGLSGQILALLGISLSRWVTSQTNLCPFKNYSREIVRGHRRHPASLFSLLISLRHEILILALAVLVPRARLLRDGEARVVRVYPSSGAPIRPSTRFTHTHTPPHERTTECVSRETHECVASAGSSAGALWDRPWCHRIPLFALISNI